MEMHTFAYLGKVTRLYIHLKVLEMDMLGPGWADPFPRPAGRGEHMEGILDWAPHSVK